MQEPSAPERLSKVTERPGQREEREEKKPAKDRNQQSEFPLCLHKLAPVWLAAGECACAVGCGGPFPGKYKGRCFTYERGLMIENASSFMLMLKNLCC